MGGAMLSKSLIQLSVEGWSCVPSLLFVCLVAQSVRLFVTPWTVALQAPLSVGILQARILECLSMASSRVSSPPRDRTQVSHIAGRFFFFFFNRLNHQGSPRILEWIAYPFSREFFQPRNLTEVSCIAGGVFTA